jgi:hypothetical protein
VLFVSLTAPILGFSQSADSLNIEKQDTVNAVSSKYLSQPLNYVSVGYGTQNSWQLKAAVDKPLSKNIIDQIGVNFSWYSTDGLSKSLYDWDTSSTDLNAGIFYNVNTTAGKLHLAGNYDESKINYYGIDELDVFASPNMDLEQNMHKIAFNSDFDFYSNNFFDYAALRAGHWWDRFNSKESFIDFKAKLAGSKENASMPLSELRFGVEADVSVNYTDTHFGLGSQGRYSYFTAGFSPVLKISNGFSYLKIGANVMYNGDFSNNNSKFFLYPIAEFMYHNSRELNIYAGFTGGVYLHNIFDLMTENPYLYSNQKLFPTNTLYKIYAGLKGESAENLEYEAEIAYSRSENLLFFARNNIGDALNPKPYNRLNTFSTVYTSGNLLSMKAALQYSLNNLILRGWGEYGHYTNLGSLRAPYNQPNFKFGADGTYKMLKNKLKLQAKLFFAGDRKSNYYYFDNSAQWAEGIKTLDSYFDADVSVSYEIFNDFSVFVSGNNLFDKNYELLENYRVQGFQLLGGISYKF